MILRVWAWTFCQSLFGIDDLLLAVVVGGILGGVASTEMGSNQTAAPPPPKVEPVVPMPVADDATVQKARQRSILEQRRRRGRASTILSDQQLSDQPLGG